MKRAAIVVVLGAGLLLGGCGLPDNTDVVPLRPGPSAGVLSRDEDEPVRNMRADTTDRAQFVRNYLTAAAGDFGGAADRVKQFLSPDAAARFKAPPDVKVVRLLDDPLVEPGNEAVTFQAREVGTLGQRGILDPSADDRVITYTLRLRQIAGQAGWFVIDAPQFLLLSDEALNDFYTPRTIYFWNRDRTGLVPDLRYMPDSVPPEQQPNQIIDWLTGGPANWLADVVDALPVDTKKIGNVPAISDDTLAINLSDQAVPADDPEALDRLQKQLRWSLRLNLPPTLELNIEHQAGKKFTGTDYLPSNPSYRTGTDPQRFVVYGGQVRRLARSAESGAPIPGLNPADNRNVRSAGLATAGSRTYVALVVNGAGGKPVLRVGAAGPGDRAFLTPVRLPGALGRPVWAKSPVGADASTSGLVTAGGRLFGFSPDGRAVREIEWPGGRPGDITAVAVAPDGHRVAVLAAGKLYVAALSSSNDDGLQLSSPQRIQTVLRDPLTAVDWSAEEMLVVAGTQADRDRVAMMEVSTDGATQSDRLDLGSNPVTYLAALTANPARGEESGTIAYVLNGSAYDDVNPERIGPGDLAEPVANPPSDVWPTAPFFLN